MAMYRVDLEKKLYDEAKAASSVQSEAQAIVKIMGREKYRLDDPMNAERGGLRAGVDEFTKVFQENFGGLLKSYQESSSRGDHSGMTSLQYSLQMNQLYNALKGSYGKLREGLTKHNGIISYFKSRRLTGKFDKYWNQLDSTFKAFQKTLRYNIFMDREALKGIGDNIKKETAEADKEFAKGL